MGKFIFCSKVFIFLIFVTLAGCSNDKNRWDVDVSDINVNVKIERFDKDFDLLNPKQNLDPQLKRLEKKYGYFYADYVEQIVNAGFMIDTNYYRNIRKILAGKPYQDLKKEVWRVFPNVDKQEQELIEACKHLKYHYPKLPLPKFIAYFSGFEVQMPVGDNYIGIGLDMFLGANNPYYTALVAQIPQYLSRRFTPDNIVPRVIEAMAREDMYPERDFEKTLLQKMIYNGKILVFLDAILPNTSDTLKIGYTEKQLKWCQNNEAAIWGFFVSENLLFESDIIKIDKYISEAPFTLGLGDKNESAPKLARWIGWQIVRKYIQKNPQITLHELMKDADSDKILRESGYKPK